MNITRRSFVAAAASAAVVAAGCSNSNETTGSEAGSAAGSAAATGVELQVFAANSLEKALPEVQELYTDETGNTFADTQFKASGDLVEQMKAGAVVDVLITASKSTMDDAETGELVDTDTRTDMFVNDLVIIRAEGGDVEINAIADVANVDGKIAIGDAVTVPAGKYTNQALASVGLYTNSEGTDGEYDASIADKVALADKVGTCAQYVSTGDCTVGFVYSSDIYRYDGVEEAFVCPEDSHKPIVYPGAVGVSSENADVAADFIDFCLTNKDAQKIWAKYGFELSE